MQTSTNQTKMINSAIARLPPHPGQSIDQQAFACLFGSAG
jgi:hypothetical protein